MTEKLESKKPICRSCLEPIVNLRYPLTGHLANVEVDILTMLEFCTSSKMDLNDDLPNSVCVSCFKTIRIAYRFLKQFYETQAKLISLKNEKVNQVQSSSQIEQELQINNNQEVTFIEYVVDDEDKNLASVSNYCEQSNSGVIDDDNIKIETYNDNSDDHGEEEDEEGFSEVIMKCEVDEEDDDDDEEELIQIGVIDGEYFDVDEDIKIELTDDGKDASCEDLNATDFLNSFDSKEENNIEVVVEPKNKSHQILRYICPICGEKFAKSEIFYTHVLSYKLSTITCPRCPTRPEFEIEYYFAHYMDCHKNHCDICDKVMSSSYGYAYHMKHHENIRRFKCPVAGCKRSFLMKHLLKRHIKSHTGEPRYACTYEFCDDIFNTKDTLRYHLKLHEGKKDHLCSVCGRAFYQAVHLRDHMYRHMGFKKFVCEICGKGFVTNGSLKKHILYCTRKNNVTILYKKS